MIKKKKDNKKTEVIIKPKTKDSTVNNTFYEQKILKSLQLKSEKFNVDLNLLKEVFERGINNWKSNEKNITKEQYAFGRVNSFLAGGKARELDSDLLEKYIPHNKVDSKPGVKDAPKPKRKLYNVTVKIKDKSTETGTAATNTMMIRASSEVEAYRLAKVYYKNSKTNKVRLNRKKNKSVKIKEGLLGSLLRGIVKPKHAGNHHGGLLGAFLKPKHSRGTRSTREPLKNYSNEVYHVYDKNNKYKSTHDDFKSARSHAISHGGVVRVEKTHRDVYSVIHHDKGHIRDHRGNITGQFGSLKDAKKYMNNPKNKLDLSKHSIAYHREKIK